MQVVKISLSSVRHSSLRSQKYSFPIFQHIPQLLHHSHFHLQIKIFLECYLANLPKDTPHVKKCALSFKLSIVLVGNLSHGLSNKCIECNECCNVYRMSYVIVVHTTMKRQMTTKKWRASLNADDLIKKTNLINELTSSRVLKKSYKYAYTQEHIIYKTESYPYNILCCTQSM